MFAYCTDYQQEANNSKANKHGHQSITLSMATTMTIDNDDNGRSSCCVKVDAGSG
jgi:hypothetical protein